jgi:hypothetical protein
VQRDNQERHCNETVSYDFDVVTAFRRIDCCFPFPSLSQPVRYAPTTRRSSLPNSKIIGAANSRAIVNGRGDLPRIGPHGVSRRGALRSLKRRPAPGDRGAVGPASDTSSKASIDILGDAGEGGATLDYQIAGFVNYQVKPKIALQGGWRYLTVHYGNNGNSMGRCRGLFSALPTNSNNHFKRHPKMPDECVAFLA